MKNIDYEMEDRKFEYYLCNNINLVDPEIINPEIIDDIDFDELDNDFPF